jgi:hypothetical protein
MKYFKTTIFNTLLTLVALFMINGTAIGQQVTLDVSDNLAGRPGDSFSVPVTADLGSNEIDNFDFEFTYDPNLVNIDVDDIEFGPQVTGTTAKNKPGTNRIKVGTFGQSSLITGETVLFTVNGTFNNSGTSASGISLTEINIGNNLSTDVTTPYDINVLVSDVAIELPTVNGTVSQSIEAAINTDDLSNLNIASYDVWFSYDETLVSVDGVNTTGTVSSGGNASLNTSTPGVAKIGWFSQSNISSSGNDLLNLELTLLSATTGTPLEFTKIEFFDGNGNQVAISGLDGNVTTSGNVAPTFTTMLPDTTVDEGETLSYTYEAVDNNGDVVTYSLGAGTPNGATIDQNTGEFSFPLSFETAGTHTITVEATDGTETTSTSATLTVTDVNRAPAFTAVLPDTTVDNGTTLEFTYMAEDADSDVLTYSLVEEVSGASLNGNVLTFNATEAGSYTITVGVTDGKVSAPVTTSANVSVDQETFEVTFNVIMRLDDSFDPNSENLYLSGSFSDWNEPGSDANLEMIEDSEDDQRYSYTMEFPAGDYNYKYFKVAEGQTGWGGEEWPGEPNRTFTVDSSPVTVTDLFGVQPGQTISIADARNELIAGDPAPIKGIVTTPDYGFSVNNFFIQDETAGLATVGFSFPANNDDGGTVFEAGQELMLMGEMGAFNDQVQLAFDSYEVVSSGNDLPEPVLITSLDQWSLDSDLQGMRVTLENMYLPQNSDWPVDKINSGAGLTTSIVGNLEQTSGTFQVFIDRDESFFDESPRPQGDFNLTGVMGRFQDVVQLYPFFENALGMATTNEPTDLTTPSSYELKQNYPNPFNPTTNITYSIPEVSDVTLEVYNALGQKVSTLVNTRMSAGSHTVKFDAGNLTSGVYFARITAGNFVTTKKMLLLK